MLNSVVDLLVVMLGSDSLILLNLGWRQVELVVLHDCAHVQWVADPNILEQLEVDEPEEGDIELLEGADDFVVDIEWQSLVELVGGHPGHCLSHQFHLIINSLDAQKCLLEALRNGAVSHPLVVEFLGHLDVFIIEAEGLVLGESGEQRNEAEGIVHVPECILESRISLLNDVTERVPGLIQDMLFCSLELFLA